MSGLFYDRRKQFCPIPFWVGAFFLISLFFWSSAFSETPSAPISRTILSVEVIGNTLLSHNQIDQAIHPFIGKDLSLAEINKIVAALTDAYRKNRFFLVKVYLPEQEIEAGKVQVSVSEGMIGNITVTGNRFYQTLFIKKHFEAGERHAMSLLESYKRATLLLNDYPDLKAEILFKPGAALGTADLEVMVKDEQPMHLSFDYNNFGSRLISRNRFGIGLDMGNLVQDGHMLSLRANFGSPIHDLKYYQGEYTVPYGYTGKRVHLAYANGDFDAGEALSQLQINMKTESVGLSVSYPFLKAHLQELLGKVGFEANNFMQPVLGRSDRIRVLRGGADYKRFVEHTRDLLSVTLTQGFGSIFGGDDAFTKGTVNWVRVRSIPQPYFIPHRYALIIAGSAQASSDGLAVSEQFAVGGPDAVRGYPFGAFLGDNGYLFSTELRASPFPNPEKIQAAIFLDHGGSFKKQQSSIEETNHFLTGVGFGARYNFPGAISLQEPDPETQTSGYRIDYRFQIRADVGFPVGDRSVSQGRSPIFYLQAAGRF